VSGRLGRRLDLGAGEKVRYQQNTDEISYIPWIFHSDSPYHIPAATQSRAMEIFKTGPLASNAIE
jgi:hypothetical protein